MLKPFLFSQQIYTMLFWEKSSKIGCCMSLSPAFLLFFSSDESLKMEDEDEHYGRLGTENRLLGPLHQMSRFLQTGSESNLRTAIWAQQLRADRGGGAVPWTIGGERKKRSQSGSTTASTSSASSTRSGSHEAESTKQVTHRKGVLIGGRGQEHRSDSARSHTTQDHFVEVSCHRGIVHPVGVKEPVQLGHGSLAVRAPHQDPHPTMQTPNQNRRGISMKENVGTSSHSPHVQEGEDTWLQLKESLANSRERYGNAFKHSDRPRTRPASRTATPAPVEVEEGRFDARTEASEPPIRTKQLQPSGLSRETGDTSVRSSSCGQVRIENDGGPQIKRKTKLSQVAKKRIAAGEELETLLWDYIRRVEAAKSSHPALFA
jgi:hypothetical protein